MHKRGTRSLRQPILSAPTRLLAALSALAALVIAGLFFLDVSRAPSPPIASAAGARVPNARFMCGGSLWCLFDASLQDRFGRPFPGFSINFFESRTALSVPPKPYPHEILIMLPAEQFLADEIFKRQSVQKDVTFDMGPEVCETHPALMMSARTRDVLTQSGKRPLATLADWLTACRATVSSAKPVRFVMADPGTCSSSWLGLADLLVDHLHVDSKKLAGVPAGELAAAVDEIRPEISIEGNSDRIEMYRFLVDGCPDDRVLLVYGHLAEPISASGSFGNCAVVTPQLHFQPIVRAIIETKRIDNISPAPYLPTLLDHFSRALLPDMVLPKPADSGAPAAVPVPTPDYATMARILELWTGPPAP